MTSPQCTRRTALAAGLLTVPLLAACGQEKPALPTATGPLVPLADVPVGSGVVVGDGENSVVVVQPETGKILAFSGVCTHQRCIVAVENDLIECPCHGSRFELNTGEVLRGPASDPLPPVPVKLAGDEVVLA